MNKVDLTKICTAPPREWLAITSDGTQHLCTNLQQAADWSAHAGAILCASTGYVTSKLGTGDSEGEKVWDGDLVAGENKIGSPFIGVIVWKDYSWYVETCETRSMSWPLWEFDGGWACRLKRIGHIHQPSGWSSEVRALLEKGQSNDRQ